jgi:ssDNA-binding replication factor A large subunit
MNIKDLKPKQGSVEVTAEVTEKGEVREFTKFGKAGRVCNAKIKDASGEMALTLWNEQIDQVNVGDTVHITNGYVNEWQGETQLTTGKFGALEVVGKTSSEKPNPEEMKTDEGSHILTEDEKKEEEILEGDATEKGPSAEASATEDELKEENLSVEEEKVE